jgi:hypothetical protein
MREGLAGVQLGTPQNTVCSNKKKMSSYLNSNVNRFYNTQDAQSILSKMFAINLTSKKTHSCVTTTPRARVHTNSNVPATNTTYKYNAGVNVNLSQDNVRIMDACDFSTGVNPIDGKRCIETMENMEYAPLEHLKMTNGDKAYLATTSIVLVGVLFLASLRLK